MSVARRVAGDYYQVNADGSISSPRKLTTASAGPVLEAIHRDPERLSLLEQPAGGHLSPTLCAYIYYAPGDYIGLHKDGHRCSLTLITSIDGPLAPLVVHPALAGNEPDELVELSRAHAGMPPGGVRTVVPADGAFLMLRGSAIPHHRPASLDHCTIATLCYG